MGVGKPLAKPRYAFNVLSYRTRICLRRQPVVRDALKDRRYLVVIGTVRSIRRGAIGDST